MKCFKGFIEYKALKAKMDGYYIEYLIVHLVVVVTVCLSPLPGTPGTPVSSTNKSDRHDILKYC